MARRSLGRQFWWLWAAYAVSAYGTGFGFGAFALIAIRVLHAGPAEVSALSAAGLAAGAVVAVPLGPWVEFRRKRPVLVAMDVARVAKGQRCLIRLEAFPATVYKGVVARLMPVADRARGAVPVRVRIEVPRGDAKLRPEMGAVVTILGPRSS